MFLQLMQARKSKNAATDALVGIWAIALSAFVIATLYFARDLLIPLALAALLTFLLSPVVSCIERWIGRIATVLLVVLMIFSLFGAAGWVLTNQLVDLATKLPQYKDNISVKLQSFHAPKSVAFTKFSDTLQELKKELPGGPAPEITQEAGKPETTVASPPNSRPLPVQVIETSKANPIELVKLIIAPLLGPIGTAALVFILVVFMLLERQDLRNRLIRLIGQGRISATTHALDDAAHRVSRYLLMQLLVNVTYGTVIAVGLSLIGLPNALLWGAFGTVLRFIPYLGPWIATILPTMLALAVSPAWTMPVLTLALFVGLELILNNVMEPLLYGVHTGVSSIALIVAAVFWTWLWGPLGLVLTTPLTVCLVVMGRHVPRLSFLSIVLSDEEALTPAEECYQRLIALDLNEAGEVADAYVKANSITALYDSVFIPVVTAAEIDRRREALDEEQRLSVEQGVRDLVEDFATRIPQELKIDATQIAEEPTPPPRSRVRVYCLPARADRDELAGVMLTQLLTLHDFDTLNASAKLAAGDLIELVEKASVEIVCISVVAPSTVIHARYLCTKLRGRCRKLKIVIGLWGATENITDATRRLRDSGTDEVVVSLAEAVEQITKQASSLNGPV
jgi:predicted PurR-regulated permease PerM